ncbi:sensor histidine kinase [Cyclobacterium qasimii]|nr:PAS domain-containing sensor histidine kinase [Cyclobacterium qasimii]
MIFLRGNIPDWLSIPVANTLIVSSTIILLIGLEKFLRLKGPQIQNILLILTFFSIHSYFTFLDPDLYIRKINFALAFVLISFQGAFLMLRRTPVAMQRVTRPVGYVFVVVFFVQISHIIYIIQNQPVQDAYFNSTGSESLFLMAWEVIVISLTYSVFLMYNKRLVNDVNEQEEKFSKAFHKAPFIIFLSKLKDGEIFEVNKSVYSISGFQPHELIGLKSIDLNIWKQNEDLLKFTLDLKSKGLVVEDEYLFRKKSGELFHGLISAEIIEINNVKCVISVINDITNRKQAEFNLRKSEASLRELNSTKDKFFSIIAHDLKSPFNGILGLSEILSEQVREKDYEGIDTYATIINSSSRHAMALLSNLMEWSRSQTGRMEFNPEKVDLVKTTKSIIELLKTSSEEKAIGISLNAPLKLELNADKAMIETVLRNLISNAIKFTPFKGEVIITVEEAENEYLLSVADSGVGIDKVNFEKLFRIDTSYSTLGTNNEKGTGLGLILCKEFIEKHKGKVGLESELGVGSRFYFTLPKT